MATNVGAFLREYQLNHGLMATVVLHGSLKEALLPHWNKPRFQEYFREILNAENQYWRIESSLSNMAEGITEKDLTMAQLFQELAQANAGFLIAPNTTKLELVQLLVNVSTRNTILNTLIGLINKF